MVTTYVVMAKHGNYRTILVYAGNHRDTATEAGQRYVKETDPYDLERVELYRYRSGEPTGELLESIPLF